MWTTNLADTHVSDTLDIGSRFIQQQGLEGDDFNYEIFV